MEKRNEKKKNKKRMCVRYEILLSGGLIDSPAKNWVEGVWDVVVFIVDFVLANLDPQVRVRLCERERGLKKSKLSVV